MKLVQFWSALRCAAVGTALCAAPAYALPADVETQIVAPVAAVNTAPLDFGGVVPGNVQSLLRIPATSDTIAVQSGNAILAGGTVSRARFDVIARPLSLVFISVPTTAQLTRVSGTEQLLLDQIQHDGVNIRLTPLSGQFAFFVGGRLRVGAAQRAGQYRGTFTVTVNFL